VRIAIDGATKAFEIAARSLPLTDEEYLEVCDELEDHFRACSEAKREEQRLEQERES